MFSSVHLTGHGSTGSILSGLFLAVFLVLTFPVQAEVITVGATGDWRHLHDAVDAALATPVNDEIHIQGSVTLTDNLDFTVDSSTGNLNISGGWSADFSVQTRDPGLTVIDGDWSRVMRANVSSGVVFVVQNLTIRHGMGEGSCGGLCVQGTGASEVFVYDVWFVENSAVSSGGSVKGGGLYLSLNDAYAEVNGNRFIDNVARVPSTSPPDVAADSGGVSAYLDGSYLQFADNFMEGNGCSRVQDTGSASGCSLWLFASNASTFEITGNTVVGTVVNGFAALRGFAAEVQCNTDSSGLMERNRWQAASLNSPADPAPLVEVILQSGCAVTQRSSLIAGAPSDGLRVYSLAASWHGANLTAAGNDGYGIWVKDFGTSSLSLFNTISHGNVGGDLYVEPGSVVDQGANLIGVNPGFVNESGGFFQLHLGSVALDAGIDEPPGGRSALDLDGLPRIQGPSIDIGAYEGTTMVFADGFENGDSTCWNDG